jgi:DNA-binding SARP family transcriptional activator
MAGPPSASCAGTIGPPRHHVPRDRLVSLLRVSRLAVVEAGAGFGKSVLAAEYQQALDIASAVVRLGPPDDEATTLVSSVRRALRGARLSDLAATMEAGSASTCIDAFLDVLSGSEEPMLLVFDDAHHLRREETAGLVFRLAGSLPPPHRLMVVARFLPAHLAPVRTLPGVTLLDSHALSFTDSEARQLLDTSLGAAVPDQQVRAVLEAAQGWVTPLVLAADALARSSDAIGSFNSLRSGRQLLATLVQGILERLDSEQQDAVIQLAHLPFLSPEVAARIAATPDLFDTAVTAGIPLSRAGSGWWEMPGPVAEYLSAKRPLSAMAAIGAAQAYAESGEVSAALKTLLAARLTGPAASMLAALEPDVAEDLGVGQIWDLVEAFTDDDVRAHPRVLLHLARVAEAGYRSDLRIWALTRSARIADDPEAGISPALRREIDAERARDLLWDSETWEDAEALAAGVVAAAVPSELVARARALDVLGRRQSWMSIEGPRADAEPLLMESARLARRVGQPTWAAQALVPLAMGVHYAACRFGRALAVLDEALAGLPARRPYRGLVESFRGDVLCQMGRFVEAEASVRAVREIGRATRSEWALALASWSEAILASYAGDRDRTVGCVLDVEQHRDVWFDQVSGLEFLSHAADLLDRVGMHELALDYLERAQARSKGFERTFLVFEAAVRARSGDPNGADEVLLAVLARSDLEPQERWPLMLLRAHAARRRGDPAAGQMAADAFETCQALGHLDGPLLREPAVCQDLLPVASDAGSASAAMILAGAGRVTISLLGGFEVRRGGHAVLLPVGKPAQAVRAVAALGGRVQADQLMEMLWPGVDPATGRNRLRNLLSRLKAAGGNVLVRDGDLVALVDGADVDIMRFDAEATNGLGAASSGDHLRGEALSRSALALYRGDLLPEDRYEVWAEWPRERLRRQYLRLLDLLAVGAEARGEIDEAVRLFQQAVEVEPYDERRYVRLAKVLASQHRMGSARAALRRGLAALSDLGVDPSPSLTSLASQLESSDAH